MATTSVELTRLMFAPDPKSGLEVELSLRPDYADNQLSPSELEVLSPVLPELITELLTMCRDKFGE
jgi:hypothetical protein